MLTETRTLLKKVLPRPFYNCLRFLRRWRDALSTISFVLDRRPGLSLRTRVRLVRQLYAITFSVDSQHTQREMLSFIRQILSLRPGSKGVIVEAGCFKGSSTAKFSLAAHAAGKELVVFDSFQGIPANDESHGSDIFGGAAGFKQGDYRGTLDEVRTNVRRFGRIENCRFVEGWFDETMPCFGQPIAAMYLDVDLASSTRTCLQYLYPLLEVGGVVYSQDGHLPLVIDVFDDDDFWTEEVGCKKPRMFGLGTSKLVCMIKEA